MRLSNTFFITRREFPKDEETLSARYLIRSGLIYKNEKGIYSYLPFGTPIFFNGKYEHDSIYPLYTQPEDM